MEMMNVHLKNIWNDSYDPVYEIVDNDNDISSIFKYNIFKRLVNSIYLWLIVVEEEEVGFVSLVYEKADYRFLFLDMGIKSEYKNKGIGKKVFQLLLEMDFKKPIIMETRVNNISANMAASKIGLKITDVGEEDKRNIYLLQKDKYKIFEEDGLLDKLKEHYEKPNNKKELILTKE